MDTITQSRDSFHAGTYVGSGKVEDLKTARTVHKAGVVLLDHELSPSQARNLEKATGAEVMDRTAVILEIFHRHARSRAAKAQVEIVRLEYMAPRMREQGKGRDRQRGGIGGKGAGESGLELDRRKIRDRIAELTRRADGAGEEQRDPARAPPRPEPRGAGRLHQRRQVDADARADRQRGLRRRQAVRDPGHHRARAAARDASRACWSRTPSASSTSCPTVWWPRSRARSTRRWRRRCWCTWSTPPTPAFERQLEVTAEVLAEIGAGDVPRLLVFNKIDRVGDEAEATRARRLLARWPDAVVHVGAPARRRRAPAPARW